MDISIILIVVIGAFSLAIVALFVSIFYKPFIPDFRNHKPTDVVTFDVAGDQTEVRERIFNSVALRSSRLTTVSSTDDLIVLTNAYTGGGSRSYGIYISPITKTVTRIEVAVAYVYNPLRFSSIHPINPDRPLGQSISNEFGLTLAKELAIT